MSSVLQPSDDGGATTLFSGRLAHAHERSSCAPLSQFCVALVSRLSVYFHPPPREFFKISFFQLSFRSLSSLLSLSPFLFLSWYISITPYPPFVLPSLMLRTNLRKWISPLFSQTRSGNVKRGMKAVRLGFMVGWFVHGHRGVFNV